MTAIYRWYNEGIYCDPPPCFAPKKFRDTFSDNEYGGSISCVKVSKWGSEWGLRNRSRVMFVAFWVSFLGMLIQVVPFLALFGDPKLIRFSQWMYAKVPNVNYPLNGNISNIVIEDITLYAGTFIIVQDCQPNYNDDCSFSKGWLQKGTCDSFNNDQNVCNNCALSFLGTVTTGFLGVFSMIPQMITNLQRSTEQGDFNCQKWLGMVNVLIALFSTLYGLLMFYHNCYRHIINALQNQSDTDVHLGSAYICLIIATLLKPFDFWAHWIVPVSDIHWNPDDNIHIKLTCCAYGISSYSSSSSSSNTLLLQQGNKVVPVVIDDDGVDQDIELESRIYNKQNLIE